MSRRRAVAAIALAGLALALAAQFAMGEAGRAVVGIVYLTGAALFVAACLAARDAGVGPPALSRRWEHGLLIAVIGVAALYRTYDFYGFPPGLWCDEGVNGVDAIRILSGGNHLTVWSEAVYGRPTLYLYLLVVSFKLFGTTMFALRIVPVVAGIAAVAALWFLARELLGAVASAAGTALFAVSRYAVTFSRISWEASLQPLLEIMAIWFVVRGLRTRSRLDWSMAGGSLAAGLYTYASFRAIPLVVLLLLAYVAVTRWPLIRGNVPGLAFCALSFAIVILPLAQYAARHTNEVTRRQRAVSVFKQIDQEDSYEPLIDNIKATAQMLNVRGDANARHNLPGEPMLDPISGALLVLGTGIAAASFRKWERGMLLGWLVITLAPGALTITYENPSAIRTIGVLPPAFLLVGLASDSLYRVMSRTTWERAAFGALALLLAGWSGGVNYHLLFDRQANSQDVYELFQPPYRHAADIVTGESGGRDVFVAPSFAGPAMDVLTYQKRFNWLDPASVAPLAAAIPRDATIVLDRHQRALEDYLVRLYPSATFEDVSDPFGRPEYEVVRVPPDAIAELHQIHAEYLHTDGTLAATDADGQLEHQWPNDAPTGVRLPFRFEWSGVLNLQDGAVRRVVLTSPGDVRLEIDGVGVREGRGSVALNLPSDTPLGMYVFRAAASIESRGVTALRWAHQGSEPAPVPRDALVADAPAGRGFLARHYQSTDWSGAVVLRTLEPYAIPVARLQPNFSVVMDGDLAITEAGPYDFAVVAEWPVVILVDGKVVVDESVAQGTRRVEGTVQLGASTHRISIDYANYGQTSFHVEWRPSGGHWEVFTGAEVTPPLDSGAPPGR